MGFCSIDMSIRSERQGMHLITYSLNGGNYTCICACHIFRKFDSRPEFLGKAFAWHDPTATYASIGLKSQLLLSLYHACILVTVHSCLQNEYFLSFDDEEAHKGASMVLVSVRILLLLVTL